MTSAQHVDVKMRHALARGVAGVDQSSRPKTGIDATQEWKSEGFDRPWPNEIKMSEEVKRRIDQLRPKLGL